MEKPGDDRIQPHAETALSETNEQDRTRETQADGGHCQERVGQKQDQAKAG